MISVYYKLLKEGNNVTCTFAILIVRPKFKVENKSYNLVVNVNDIHCQIILVELRDDFDSTQLVLLAAN